MADIIFPDEEPASVIGLGSLPTNGDLVFWKGDAVDFTVKLNDSNNTPLDLSAFTSGAVMRASFNAPTVYAFNTYIQNTNEVRVYLPSAVSKTIPAGDYIWNLQLTAVNGDVRTFLAGDVKVYAEVDV